MLVLLTCIFHWNLPILCNRSESQTHLWYLQHNGHGCSHPAEQVFQSFSLSEEKQSSGAEWDRQNWALVEEKEISVSFPLSCVCVCGCVCSWRHYLMVSEWSPWSFVYFSSFFFSFTHKHTYFSLDVYYNMSFLRPTCKHRQVVHSAPVFVINMNIIIHK